MTTTVEQPPLNENGWPEWMPVPRSIGSGEWFADGCPVCADGFFAHAFGQDDDTLTGDIGLSPKQLTAFRDAYNRAAATVGIEVDGHYSREPACIVTEVNDRYREHRQTLYQAALWLCGYTEGVSKAAAKLGQRTLKRFPDLRKELGVEA